MFSKLVVSWAAPLNPIHLAGEGQQIIIKVGSSETWMGYNLLISEIIFVSAKQVNEPIIAAKF